MWRVVSGVADCRILATVDISIEKIEMGNVLVRKFLMVVSVWSLLSGCADTRQSSQADSDSVLRKAEGEHEVHGEVGVMYGHTMR